MSNPRPLAPHLRDALLIGALDDELTPAETASAAAHLAACSDCWQRYQSLRRLSSTLDAAIASPAIESAPADRSYLEAELLSRELTHARKTAHHPLRRLSYSLAIAAAVAFALLWVPQWKHSSPHRPTATLSPNSFELDGETFVALPYSNPDLPLNSSHIVRMEVPVSSLAQAGVVFEPISNQASAQDGSVLADVLLGIDGQPLGVHVLGGADNALDN